MYSSKIIEYWIVIFKVNHYFWPIIVKPSLLRLCENFGDYENADFFQFGFEFGKLDFVKTHETQKSRNELLLHCFITI